MDDRLVTIDVGRKVRAAVPLSEGSGSPFNTRPTAVQRCTLIHSSYATDGHHNGVDI